MSQDTDAQLVARAREGDLSAFEMIVGRHRAALVALAAGRLGSLADAEDVAQEAFVQAFFRLHQLRKPEALLPWLRRLTDRLALMRLRRRREEPVEPTRIAEMRREQAPGTSAAEELLSELPAPMRQTVALTYLAGYTCAETASLLGIREGTVKSRLSRARTILREVFTMAEEELPRGKPSEQFTQQSVERLMREARRLLAEGDLEGAAQRADEVLGIQAQELFARGDPHEFRFNQEAARISGLLWKEKRRRDCEANAAQYGFTLEELDWELEDVDMLEGTLGKAAGHGEDWWGIPHSRRKLKIMDARDICRRLGCSPLTLHQWVKEGCPVLRCWPFARFDWQRVKKWLTHNGVTQWPNESHYDLDRPIRLIFKALHRGDLTPEQAENVLDSLDL